MKRTAFKNGIPVLLMVMMLCLLLPVSSHAVINGLTGALGTPVFNFTAKDGHIRSGDGDSIYMWGYAPTNTGVMQYPGPTLIVTVGDVVTINLTNQLPLPVSMVFPGHSVTAVQVTGTAIAGLLTTEVPPDKGATTVSYTFTASQPGTYTYYSGTRPDLEVEMGLVGTLIVRPTGFNPATVPGRIAYNDPIIPTTPPAAVATAQLSSYDREYLFFLSDIDVNIHKQVELGQYYLVDTTNRHATSWFENGRNFPDTMADENAAYLPSQPYSAMPQMHPGERVLIRLVGAGRDLHPFHTHGQNHLIIARDGRLLNNALSNTGIPDLAVSDFTTTSIPGETVDEIWGPWTGAKLGWDAYGPAAGIPLLGIPAHTCTPGPGGFDITGQAGHNMFEYCPDHNKPFPVSLPDQTSLTFGQMYGGTPFLAVFGALPPVNVRQNQQGAMTFMWHSHAEREITTNNIFIGGMATMAFVLPYTTASGVPIIIDQFKP